MAGSATQPRISVIVLSYNTKEKLRRCLSQIEPHHELIVVDNASQDGSAAMVAREFPHAKLQANDENVGFGRGNNQGVLLATGDLVLFLNSDAYADPGAIDTLAEVFADASVVAAGGKLLNPDRSLQWSTANELRLWSVFCEQTNLEKLLPDSKLFSPYWTTRRLAATESPSESTQVMGACMMVRADRGMPPELFDDRYFFYCEDTDLCVRLRRHGRIVYVPKATFIHELGSSSAGDPSKGVMRYNWGKELYFFIHHGSAASNACWLLDRMGAAMRLLAWSAIALFKGFTDARSRAQVKGFWRVLTAPRRYS